MRKIVTILFNTLKTLSFKKILKLLRLIVPHPIFAALGFYATVKSFMLAQDHFPQTNASSGIGNAYRHALWTCLIMMYCCKVSSPKKSLNFCKRMTDLHEDLFPNEPLEKKMDLHNNKVGMDLFMELLPGIHRQFFETNFLVEKLFVKTKTAKVLTDLEEDWGSDLVYLQQEKTLSKN